MERHMSPIDSTGHADRGFTVVDLNYFTIYVEPLADAVAFYTRVFGAPACVDAKMRIHGWKLGSTCLTLLESRIGPTPESTVRGAEFAVQVSAPEEVDTLYALLLEAGARSAMAPSDTEMYEPMRFCCVDDPFGTRVDVYCGLSPKLPGTSAT
jgi:uncharacterized glyoxalase superfamily protein PhnB